MASAWRDFLGEESQRIAEDFGEVVTHQQRLVLVHRERRVALGRVEVDAQASLFNTGFSDELRQLIVEPEPRILEVDRIDRVLGHGHLHARGDDAVLGAEANQTRKPPSGAAVDNAVEVHEADRLTRAVRMPHAGTQPAGDEREVRIGVLRLDCPLGGIEVVAPLQPVMLVAGAFREQPAERIDVGRDMFGTETGRETPVEKPGRRVRRPVETMRKGAQRLVLVRESRTQLDDVEPGARGKLERQIERFPGHQRDLG